MIADWLDWIIALAALAWAVFGFWAAAHALMYKRDPRAALGWSLLCLLAPVVGPAIYLGFGINRISKSAKKLGHLPAFNPVPGRMDKPPPKALTGPADAAAFVSITDQVAIRPLVHGNSIRLYTSGDDAYAEMLDDIERAQRTVMLASYIFRSDVSGRKFVERLKGAADRGVRVWVLIDGVGKLYSLPWATRLLKNAGVTTATFIPLGLIPPSFHLNLRNHRKLLVVDGEIGYTGGMNIGDHHTAGDDGAVPVADMHFRLTGPIVNQLGEVFEEDWHFATTERLAASLPATGEPGRTENPAGHAWARAICDGPDDDLGKFELIIQSAVSAAKRSVRIVTPYFLPTRSLIAALKSAALRGIEVDIVLPEKSNLRYVDWATRNLLWELLKWNIRVWYQPAPFAHTKLFIVDESYVHIGSANIDPRSLRLNFEIAVEVYDDEFGATITRHIDEMIDKSRAVTLLEVDSRSLPARLRDSIAWVFSPYL